MPPDFALAFVCQLPCLAVLPDAQQFAALPQRLGGKVVERVHLVGAGGNEAKSSSTQFALEFCRVVQGKLDFYFAGVGRHEEIILK